MKKIASLILVICMLLISTVSAYAAVPKVVVGGESLKSDVAPIILEGRILLPLRAVFESIGAEVDYIASEQRVVATKKGTTVEFVIGSNIMKINGQEKTIDVPAMIKDNRTLVPLRACAEAFDLPIEWNQKTNTARVRIPVSVLVEEYGPGFGGQHYVYTYDDRGNKIEQNYNGSITKWFYDENDNEIRVESKYSVVDRIYTYTENGDIATCETHSSMEGAPVIKTTYEYDERRNLIYSKNTENSWYAFEYDERGNKTREESRLNIITYEYDDANRLTYRYAGKNNWQRYYYDDYGNLLYTVTDQNPDLKFTFDKTNNVGIVEDDTEKRNVYYEYDNNKLTLLTQGEGVFKDIYKYDMDGNLLYSESHNGNIVTWEKYKVILK